jgi:phosphoglycerate kinase
MIHYLSKTNPTRLQGVALLRLDFNTEDDWRLEAAIPTVKFLLKHAEKVVIISHRGRPTGIDAKFSLKKSAGVLARFIRRQVTFVPTLDFMKIKSKVSNAPKGSIFLLENLRFNAGEEKNDSRFAKQLAGLADYYVNDAFAVSHRANASVVAITKLLPSYAGFEMEREISALSKVISSPKRPVVVILGGAKAEDKLGIIQYFKRRADWFLLGGGPANTILSLRGVDVKKSVRDKNPKDAKTLKTIAGLPNVILPADFTWHKNCILDLGPKSVELFNKKIAFARTIIWSGPLGLIENKKYAKGSIALSRAIVKNRKAFSVSGGGETVMFLKKYGFDKKFSFISTGGGAMVDFLGGKVLPGIKALNKK